MLRSDIRRAIEQLDTEARRLPLPLSLSAILANVEIEAAVELDCLTVDQVHTLEGALTRVRGD